VGTQGEEGWEGGRTLDAHADAPQPLLFEQLLGDGAVLLVLHEPQQPRAVDHCRESHVGQEESGRDTGGSEDKDNLGPTARPAEAAGRRPTPPCPHR
jgi:hypothetical protein